MVSLYSLMLQCIFSKNKCKLFSIRCTAFFILFFYSVFQLCQLPDDVFSHGFFFSWYRSSAGADMHLSSTFLSLLGFEQFLIFHLLGD